MLKQELTGERRFRVETRLFRKPLLVLQVQRRVFGYQHDEYTMGHDVDYVEWFDAGVEHITVEKQNAD